MKIALAQVNPVVGDLERNVERCLDSMQKGRELGADLVLLPELAVTGSPPRDILFDSSFIEAARAANQDLAERNRDGPPVLVGTILPSGAAIPHHPALFNAALLLENGKHRLAAAKRLLRNDDIHFEGRWFIPGESQPPITIAGYRVGVCFAADLDDAGSPVKPCRELKAAGAEVITCLGALPFQTGMSKEILKLGKNVATPVAVAMLAGGNDEVIFSGQSYALDARGRALARLPFGEEITELVDMATVNWISDLDIDPMEETYYAIVLGIRDFYEKNRIRKVYLGISGGVDSAVVVALAVEALGPENVTAISIPSRFTDPRSVESARQLCASLGNPYEVFGLEEMHQAVEKSMGRLLDEGTGAENIQARLRAMVLMGYVNRHGGMLLNTSNKTELSAGYITLYGDMAGVLSPIGDLTKPEVVRMAQWIHNNRVPIPNFILERPPSAELKPGQVDPFDYPVVGPALEDLVRSDRSNEALRRSEYKRRQMGVILRVSSRAFGPGRLIPVTRR